MADRLERGLVPRLGALLAAIPVVVLEGPRASGKTAIGSILGAMGLVHTVADLSDPTVRAAAEASPTTFVENLEPIVPCSTRRGSAAPRLLPSRPPCRRPPPWTPDRRRLGHG